MFGGSEVKPSTVAQEALGDMTRERYDRLQELYTPVENEVLNSLGDRDNRIEYASRDAGRDAGARTRLLQEAAAYDRERRGIEAPAADQAIIDRRNTYNEKVNTKRAETSGALSATAAYDRDLAGANNDDILLQIGMVHGVLARCCFICGVQDI